MKVLVYAVTKIVSSCYATFRRNEIAKVIMLYILMLRLRYTIYLMTYGVIVKRVSLFLYLSLVAPSYKSLMPVSMFHVIGAGVSHVRHRVRARGYMPHAHELNGGSVPTHHTFKIT